MSKKKIIAVSIVLALILLIGGMIAYFTDTDNKTNVFVLGDNVDIALNETFNATVANGVHPGTVVEKAPKVVNQSTTTPAYVFLEVKVPLYKTVATGSYDAELFTYEKNAAWYELSHEDDLTNGFRTYVYAYGTSSAMTSLPASQETPTLFNNVTLVSTLTAAQKNTAPTNPNIDIVAKAIQIDNVGTTPAEVYAKF
jgi:predicted ribosomally synthesized peptide with SipW-like signal peptide